MKTLLISAAALLLFAAPAAAGDGRYVHLACADPRTGETLGTGSFNGFETSASHGAWHLSRSSCAGYAQADADHSLALRPKATAVPRGTWAALSYRVPNVIADDVELVRATYWRAMRVAPSAIGEVSSGQHTASTFADPFAVGSNPADRAAAGDANASRGSAAAPFAPANAVTPTIRDGAFAITVRCEAAQCAHDADDWSYDLFGARLELRDAAPPELVEPATGSLATGDPTAGDLRVYASDRGAGLYALHVKIDGQTVTSRLLAGPAETCQDRNHDSGTREFAGEWPCPPMASHDLKWDTREVQDGQHRLVVTLEDAGGNETTIVDRMATFDNVPDPSPLAASPPKVTGATEPNGVLAALPGGWRNADAYEFAWQRCAAGGTTCSTLPATGATYVAGDADIGSRLRVRVIGRNKAGETAEALSPASAVVATPLERRAEAPAPAPAALAAPAPLAALPAGRPDPIANGRNATRSARLTLTTPRARVKFSARPTVAGRLTDAAGRPIAGATIALRQQLAAPGSEAAGAGVATTKPDGTFIATAPAGASRTLTATYRAFSTDDRDAATAAVRLTVTARLSLRAKPARVGRPTMLTGRLVDLPRAGVQIQMQAKDGAKWRTFDMTTTRRGGTFRYGYRFKRAAAGRAFLMRVLVDSPIYPFARAASRPVLIRVPM